jgi:hypothetical protein
VKTLYLTCVLTLTAAQAFAQSTADDTLATPTGHEVIASVSYYRYVEPGAMSIAIHGAKIGGEYIGSFSIDQRRHWFVQADVRGIFGNATYDGWCAPFLIRPNNSSPNGWALGLGDYTPCSESGDKDWYVEGRALVGKDVIRQKWGLSPFTGIGLRHLSNGTTGISGFRTDNYLYLPLGLTTRTNLASQRALSFTVEVDALLRGWQKTRDSQLGSGDIPATAIAPAFTINGFSDISFSQSTGFALRASSAYHLTRRWSIEPYYVYWHVGASPVNYETATFTVRNITVQQQLGAYEPTNYTHEVGVKVGIHF